MDSPLIDDRGELIGTRITVYNLLPYFVDPTATELYLGELYRLAPEQVAAARAFVLNNLDTVLAQHLRIEQRNAAGNPPEVIDKATRTRQVILDFKGWLAKREQARAADEATPAPAGGAEQNGTPSDKLPSFREWLAEREAQGRSAGGG